MAWALGVAALFAYLYAVANATEAVTGFDWLWHREQLPRLPSVVPLLYYPGMNELQLHNLGWLLGALAAGALGLVFLRRHTRIALAWLVLTGMALQVDVAGLHGANGLRQTVLLAGMDGPMGFARDAFRTPAYSDFMDHYVDFMERGVSSHVLTHPSGDLLFYWLPERAANALPTTVQRDALAFVFRALGFGTPGPDEVPSRALAIIFCAALLLLLAALVVVPLYGCARALGKSAQEAVPLAALGILIPGVLVFAPGFDSIYPTAAAAMLYCALRGRGFLAGLVCGAALFFSYGLWVLALPTAIVSGRFRFVLWAVLGGGLVWAMILSQGYDLRSLLQIAESAHRQLTATRPYWEWLPKSLLEFGNMAGFPLVIAAAVAAWRRSRAALAFSGTVLALTAAGVVRGETGRIWLFLVPFALVGVYAAGFSRRTVYALAGAQAACCVCIAVFY